MGSKADPTNTQRTILISLAEGWLLRYVDDYGWCLFQVGRKRPFARVKRRTVDHMTSAGWLTPGHTSRTHSFRPAKDLTGAGRRIAEKLIREEWSMNDEWAPPSQNLKFDDGHRRARRRAA